MCVLPVRFGLGGESNIWKYEGETHDQAFQTGREDVLSHKVNMEKESAEVHAISLH